MSGGVIVDGLYEELQLYKGWSYIGWVDNTVHVKGGSSTE